MQERVGRGGSEEGGRRASGRVCARVCRQGARHRQPVLVGEGFGLAPGAAVYAYCRDSDLPAHQRGLRKVRGEVAQLPAAIPRTNAQKGDYSHIDKAQ